MELTGSGSEFDIPTFHFPWPAACHPDAAAVEAEMLDWGAEHELFPGTADGAYLHRVERSKYGWLAARCYPEADRRLLRAAADYFLWFFLVDDLCVDRVETVTDQTVPRLTATIDVLDFGRVSAQPVYGETAWCDVLQRLRALVSDEHFDRFAQGMRLWAATAGLQILHHTRMRGAGHAGGIPPPRNPPDADARQ